MVGLPSTFEGTWRALADVLQSCTSLRTHEKGLMRVDTSSDDDHPFAGESSMETCEIPDATGPI